MAGRDFSSIRNHFHTKESSPVLTDPVVLSRIQFAMTVGFHFLFPPITIGLAWLLVITEWLGWRRNDEHYVRLSRFFAKLFALTFGVGVATGIVMEFQFGTNWAKYSRFVGDIFGAPLAAEGMFAFFLESVFLGLYLFGRGKVSKGLHFFSIVMVAVGALISAFWILVANSWQQTPAGYAIRNGRAELVDFWAAVFNPSTIPRVTHTVSAALVSGAFFMAGIAAIFLLRNPQHPEARRALRVALIFGFISSIITVFPTGDISGRQVAKTQPEKFAAIEGLYTSQSAAPFVIFAYPEEGPPPKLKLPIEVRGIVSLLAFGDFDAHVVGLDQFPPGDVPPLWLTFVSFHNMVLLGLFFIAATGWGVLQLKRGKLWEGRRFLKLLVVSIPLPLAACQLGWMAAEVGRQPWIVYRLLRTRDAISPNVGAAAVWTSLILVGLVYALILCIYIYLVKREVDKGMDEVAQEVA